MKEALLITDPLEIKQCVKVQDILGAMQEFDTRLYALKKWGFDGIESTPEEFEIIGKIQEEWNSFLKDHNVNLQELYP